MNLQKKQRLVLILGVLSLVLLIVNGTFWFARLDMTNSGSYRISRESQTMLASLQAPVQITYYLSGSLKSKHPTFQQIEDVLLEYEMASSGKVNLELVNPAGREKELNLEGLGLQPEYLNMVENTQVTQALVYSGLVIRQLDAVKVIPFVSSPQTLEYDLAVQISQIDRKKPLVVGVLNGTSSQDPTAQYNVLAQQFSSMVEVRPLQRGEPFPLDLDVLLAFKIEDYSKQELLDLERFALSGKGLLLGVDPYSINLQYGVSAQGPEIDRPLFSMLETWGVTVEGAMVMSPSPYNKTFPMSRQEGKVQYVQEVPYPYWLALAAEDANRSHPVSTNLLELDLFWASPLKVKEGVEAEVLFKSIDSSVVQEGAVNADPTQADGLLEVNQGQRQSFPLVLARTGDLSSYLSAEFPEAQLPASSSKAKIILVGDGDFASDLVRYTNSVGNIEFIQSAITWLNNDEALNAIKSRDSASPPLTKIRSTEGRVMVETMSLVLNAVIIPLVVLGLGLLRGLKRRK